MAQKQITIDLDAINRTLAAELGGHAEQLKAEADENSADIAGMEHFAGIDIGSIETEFCTIAPQAIAWGNRLVGWFGWVSPSLSAKLKAFLNVIGTNVIPTICGGP